RAKSAELQHILLFDQIHAPPPTTFLFGLLEPGTLVQMRRGHQGALGPEDDLLVAALLAERQGLVEESLAESSPPGLRIDQEPAKLGCLGRRGDNGNTADDPAILFGKPKPFARRDGAYELGEWARDIGLEARIEASFPRVDDAVQGDDGAHIARPQARSQSDRSSVARARLHRSTSYYPRLVVDPSP